MVGKSYIVPSRRNFFPLNHKHHLTMKQGYAYPVLCLKYKPGDSFKILVEQMTKLLPLVTPTLSDIKMRCDFFRVDHGVVWPEFYDFVKQNGSEDNPIVIPYKTIPSGGYAESSLMDYLGIKPGTGAGVRYNALAVRTYNKIMNDHYINTNVQEEVEIGENSGEDLTTPTDLRKVLWKRDRFTNAEVTTQQGGDVILPIGQSAPVELAQDGDYLNFQDSANHSVRLRVGAKNGSGNRDIYSNGPSVDSIVSDSELRYKSGMVGTADLSEATGVSLRALSVAKTLQHLREVDLFAGKHYPDWQFANYGVKSSDARLQRSEWLGGFKWNVITSEVLQTSETTATSVQGTMAGHGFSYGRNSIYVPYLDNFGYIMAIVSVMPEPEYCDGMSDYLCMEEPFEWARPILSHMPLQEIKNKEIYLQDASVVDSDGKQVNDNRFAFEPIYDNYRHLLNRVSGAFRSSLSFWLAGLRKFPSLPVYNEDFIEANPSTDIFAVDNDDQILSDFFFKISSLQKLPKEGVPQF